MSGPPTLKELATQRQVPECPLCKRPNLRPSDHHVIPRCRGGEETLSICSSCHGAIHKTFTNKELERQYNTVEALMAHEGFVKIIRFIAKQDPGGRVRTELARSQRRRGRNG